MKVKNKKGKNLILEERIKIEGYIGSGESFKRMAKLLKRGETTIRDEVKRNGGKEKYNAKKAQKRAELKQYRKKKDCNKIAMDRDLQKFVEQRLEAGWSPEDISERLKIQSGISYASAKSIRKYIKKRPHLERFLFWERNNKKSGPKKQKTSERLTDRKFIEERPSEAELEYGHWEGDFIVSKHNSYALLVLVEKYSKYTLIKKLPNRKNDLVNEAIFSMLSRFKVKTLTLDNDIAFQKHKILEEMINAPIYFCHPYHSWEKGLVENTNRWIRQFIPKKANISLISNCEIVNIQSWWNNKARKCLYGFTAYEKMMSLEYNKFINSLVLELPRVVV